MPLNVWCINDEAEEPSLSFGKERKHVPMIIATNANVKTERCARSSGVMGSRQMDDVVGHSNLRRLTLSLTYSLRNRFAYALRPIRKLSTRSSLKVLSGFQAQAPWRATNTIIYLIYNNY